MKNIVLTGFITLLALTAYPQERVSELRITGRAQAYVSPNRSTVSLTIQSQKETYSQVIEDLSARIDLLQKELKKAKLAEGAIKTAQFQVRANYVYESGNRKQNGFIGSQTLDVKFPLDNNQLITVLNCAANSQADPEIAMAFDLNDDKSKEIKLRLMREAVQDARAKAELLASEAGYSVVGVKEISYDSPNSGPVPVYRADALRSESAGLSVSPQDLGLSEYVNIIYILQQN